MRHRTRKAFRREQRDDWTRCYRKRTGPFVLTRPELRLNSVCRCIMAMTIDFLQANEWFVHRRLSDASFSSRHRASKQWRSDCSICYYGVARAIAASRHTLSLTAVGRLSVIHSRLRRRAVWGESATVGLPLSTVPCPLLTACRLFEEPISIFLVITF